MTIRGRSSLRALFALATAAGVGACSPDKSSGPAVTPAAPPNASSRLLGLDPLLQTTTTTLISTVDGTLKTTTSVVSGLIGLLTCSPQDQLKASKYIGPLGGRIAVGSHELVIPSGALGQTVLITATQQSGTVALVDFQPHGLRFAKAASLRMNYGSCSTTAKSVQSVVYVNDSNQIVEMPPSVDNAKEDNVSALINHFSGYAIATNQSAQ